MTANTDPQDEFPISVQLQGNYHPAIFDLSGTAPFELYLNIRRSEIRESDPRDLVLLKTGSAFDLPAALDSGFVELVDGDSGEVIHPAQQQDVQPAPAAITPESFITLPTDAKGKDRQIQSVPLDAASCLRALVQPGHTYRLRLRDKNLGVRWWTWSSSSGSEPLRYGTELLQQPNQPQRLVSSRQSCSKTFTVVSETARPPKVSINLSLATVEGERSPPVIQITVTNPSDQRYITLKISGDQPYRQVPDEISNPRPRVTAERPAIQNFSVVDQDTQEDTISDAPTFVSYIGGGSGWPRKQFLTLAPGERVIRTVTLPERLCAQAGSSTKEYHVSLRRTGCWWADGTVDDLFGTGNAFLKRLPAGPKLPMELVSDDVVVARC